MKDKLIPNHSQTPVIDIFLKDLRDYLPASNYEPVISQEEQNKILEKFKNNARKAKFSFVIDGLSGQIKYCFGVEKWLGYSPEAFTTKKFLEITHPAHSIAHWMNGASIWNVFSVHKEFVTFYDLSLVYTSGVKHLDGTYILCSCEAFFFQISKDGKGLEFGYEYTILKDLNLEDFNISFYDKNGRRPDVLNLVVKAKKNKFKSVQLFSTQEMRILHRYAYDENTNSEDIAKAFKIDKKTVSTHNTNILDKAEIFFYYRFDSAKKFAQHLKRLDLI